MPELPEVETVKEKLKERLLKRTIKDVDILWDNIIEFPTKDLFISQLVNQSINDIKRRGKWLMFELDDYYLLVHLRMEGKFFLKSSEEERNKHEHVIFLLDNNIELRYHDTRKFGKMHLITKNKINSSKPLSELGLEPFDDLLDVKYLKAKLKHKLLPIKLSLLDQSIIVGIGNIYANEILFLAGIDPFKPSNKLTSKQLQLIIDNTKKVLSEAIKLGGTTIRSYVSLDNKKGSFQDQLYVHQRANQPCLKCGTTIIKTFIGGRGTYYCPKCQN